jgi:hypothetical protein
MQTAVNRVELQGEFRGKVQVFLKSVSYDTLETSYEELIGILLLYKELLSREDIYTVFSLIEQEGDLTLWQEEVIWEVSSRLARHCVPHKAIDF